MEPNASVLDGIRKSVYRLYNRRVFDQAKQLLLPGVTADAADWQSLLEMIGTEESFQRCCERDHAHENILYALYELTFCASKGEPLAGLGIWPDAVGLNIDGCYACANLTPALIDMGNGKFLVQDRLVLTSGDRAVILEGAPNIYLNSCGAALRGQFRTDLSSLLPFCRDAAIAAITFQHQEFHEGTTLYRQPVICIAFDSGAALRFTTNFGEVPEEQTAMYFEICNANCCIE